MHEYSIAQALVEQINDVARQNGADAVTRVVIQVGKLRAVVPEILRWGFEIASEGSIAEGAELEVEVIPIVIRCRACSTERELDDPFYVCPACNSFDVEQLSGNELILKTLEISDDRDSRSSKHHAGQ